MSFENIISSDVVRKKKEVVIGEYKFYANELTYPQRLHLAILQQGGGDSFTQMIVYSITDKDGKRMTIEQASKLSDEHAAAFFIAATDVNGADAEKN